MAVRLLTKQRLFTLVAVTTLALGIGANTAIFSVVYGVLLRPLGIRDAEQVAVLTLHREAVPSDTSGFYQRYLEDMRAEVSGSAPFERFASFIYESVTLEETESVTEIGSAVMVDGEFFGVMGVAPLLGRVLTPDDVVPGQIGDVCVIGETLWRQAFGADPSIIDRDIVLDGRAVRVVGVLPAKLPLPDAGAELWMIQDWDPDDRNLLGRIGVLLRLSEDNALPLAQSRLRDVAERLGRTYPRFAGYTISVLPFRESLVGSVRPAIVLAASAVGLILLIACANTASLLLARATVRGAEISTRRALGAKRSQLASQLLAESLALSTLGGAVGLVVAFWFHRMLLAVAPSYLPRLSDVRLDLPVLLFSFGVSVAAGVLFGFAPMTRVAGSDSKARGATAKRSLLGDGLIVAQLALSVMLLVAAGLMLRSLSELRSQDLGFDPVGVAGARIYLDSDTYGDDPLEEAYFATLLERLRARPEIEKVGASSGLPLDPFTIDYDLPYSIGGQAADPEGTRQAFFRSITAGYIETMRIRLLSGRTFESTDRQDTVHVALVNETFASVGWPDQDPIGRTFSIYGGAEELLVVGVVGDVHFGSPGSSFKPEFFVPHSQFTYGAMTVVARSRDPSAAALAIASEALAINRRQPVSSTFALETLLARSLSTDRFLALLLSLLSVLALLISSAGVYGVLSYWVNQSRREIGVRMAFGASARAVVAHVVNRGITLAAVGIVVGVGSSVVVGRFMQRFLFGVGAMDGFAVAAGVGVLLTAAIAASLVPAWRAAHLDPMASLKVD